MLRRKFNCTIMFLFCFFFTGNLLASTPSPMVDGLRKSVLALDSAWNMALKDLQQKKSEGSLQDTAKQAVADLPCPDESAIASSQEISFSPTKTDQVAELDKSLTQALGEFDEQLLKEEQKIAARLPSERESGNGKYGGGGGMSGPGGQTGKGGQGTTGTAGTGGQPGGKDTGSSSSGSGQGSQTSAKGTGAGSGQPSTTQQQPGGRQEIESGYDDIVARQLREAAEKETDPELKKKLWEEYRKYKEGTN
jgi:hypothetical protein